MSMNYHLNKLLKKVTSVISIFAIITATSVGFSTSAYAAAANQTATVQTVYTTADDYTFTAATATTTLAAATGTAATFVTTAGTPTAWGITAGTLTVTTTITTTANAALAITLSGTGNLTIGGATVENATAGAMTLVLGGNTFTTTGAVTHALAISGAGAVVVSGTTTFSDTIGAGTAVTSITTATGKTTTFSAAVTATGAVTTTLTGAMTFAANATAGSFSIGTGGSMSVLSANANTITGTIDGDAAGAGTLVINNTNAAEAIFASNIGSTNSLLLITGTEGATFNGDVSATTLTLANGKIMDFAGDLTVTTATLTGTTSSVIFDGTVDQTITGNIVGAAAGNGLLTVNNTTGKIATFEGNIGSAAAPLLLTTVSAAKSAVIKGTVFSVGLTTGALTEITLENNGHIIGTPAGNTGVLTIATGTILNIGRGVVAGEIVIDTKTTTAGTTGQVISGAFTLNLPSNFTSGVITLFDGDDADAVTAATELAFIVPTNTSLTTYIVSHAGGAAANEDVIVTATARTTSAVANQLGTDTNKGLGFIAANTSVASSTDTVAIDALTTLLNAGNNTNTREFAKQAAPQTDVISGSVIASQAVTSGVQNVMSNRMASLRSGDGYTSGVVTGNGMSANSGFIQAFGSSVEQKNRGTEFGYDADTTGFAIGFDTKVANASVIGISYANSSTDVGGKGTGKSNNDIKTDALSLYTDFATANGYVEGSITYGQSENKGSRIINTAGLNRTYSSDYDSEQYSFRISGGMPQDVGNGMFVTPYAGATISQIKADAYTERSNTVGDALRLRIAQDTVDSQVGTLGIKVHKAFKNNGVVTTPEFKLAVSQEFGDDKITSTNTYQGGGASFKNSTDIEQTSGTIGLGVNVVSDAVTFNIGYEADVREKYLGHSAQAKLSVKF